MSITLYCNTFKDWSSSKLFCESIGMKLASVTSQAQWDALDNAYGTGDFVHGMIKITNNILFNIPV